MSRKVVALCERQEMAYQPIVKQLSQLLMNDWDNRSTMVNPLPSLALLGGARDESH